MKTLDKKLVDILENLPQIGAGIDLWQNKFHEFDVYGHTMLYAKLLSELTEDSELLVAGYLHDIGKPAVAVSKFKDGLIQEKSPGIPYHEFDDHEIIGEKIVREMPTTLFKEYGLNQERIAKLVGAHYIPMEGIKQMRKAKTYSEFEKSYSQLIETLNQTGLPKEDVMTMFLVDKLAQGKSCSDREELFAIRELVLGNPEQTLEKVYQMQKAAYGGKE